MLYYAMLYYAILYYTILYYIPTARRWSPVLGAAETTKPRIRIQDRAILLPLPLLLLLLYILYIHLYIYIYICLLVYKIYYTNMFNARYRIRIQESTILNNTSRERSDEEYSKVRIMIRITDCSSN